MAFAHFRRHLRKTLGTHITNLPGWRTNRKIVVIESDDWGSIRMPSKQVYDNLSKAGIPVEKSHYNRFDSLESNADLERLYEVLAGFKDKNGNHPAFTGVCVVANPDFEKIQESGFKEYFYEPFSETLNRYPAHDRVLDLWKKGADKRIFVPQFHGREHLNVQRWMRDLQVGNPHTMLAFENQLWGITSILIPRGYQPAFEPDVPEDISYHASVLDTGIEMFKNLMGYTPEFFVPPNGPFNHGLMPVVARKGIKYIMLDKWQKEPLGNEIHKNRFHYLGKKNKQDIMCLSRNASFEPSSNSLDWVDKCLSDIAMAFRMKKPATISTHRVNYIGFLEPVNRDRSLKLLKDLLNRILKKWPDVEFMTSPELGAIIEGKK